MPTYDYGCEACGASWELEQRISADPVKKCPKCGKMKARRMISGGNFILKGSGWYADLYHKPAAGGSKKKEESAGSSASSSDGDKPAKSETKSEKKETKAAANE